MRMMEVEADVTTADRNLCSARYARLTTDISIRRVIDNAHSSSQNRVADRRSFGNFFSATLACWSRGQNPGRLPNDLGEGGRADGNALIEDNEGRESTTNIADTRPRNRFATRAFRFAPCFAITKRLPCVASSGSHPVRRYSAIFNEGRLKRGIVGRDGEGRNDQRRFARREAAEADPPTAERARKPLNRMAGGES